ncbi:hypothetical protein HBN50_15760 [Halobacteriovorax sp. GB3]|uniref:hypothetical protein n=1 Tax=Halobacteriovorax sp. GB3 TaxID=2719615 RepID=UPI00236306C0|nr:hypothetical protein [Halobacteriovorax sp. GB3]MDD0854568.1 hypothetical protein [Halobacteriovorax sp. GB3]
MFNDNKAITCYNCNKELSLTTGQKILRSEECPHCYASVHCCKMCNFYDPSAYNECRESSADRIVDKEKANFCDYFILKGTGNSGSDSDDIMAQANALFKD